jgi:small subunit ribosomal protein S17
VPAQVRTKTGHVVSDKMQKTIVVAVESVVQHPLYKKRIRRTKKFKAHDENGEAHIGDVVRIAESRPISKEKSWRLVEIVRAAHHTTAEGS